MALILPFVLLVCTLAARNWSMDPSLQTAIPVSTTLFDNQVTKRVAPGALPHRNDTRLQRAEAVLEWVCGLAQSGCTAHGYPEICCPAKTTCQRDERTASRVICCPGESHCSHEGMVPTCPVYTFACPSSLHGGCCPVGLRCARFHCLKYEYQTLADFAAVQSIRQQYPPRILLIDVATSSLSSPILRPPDDAASKISTPPSLTTAVPCVAATTADALCNPGSFIESTMNLPIAVRTWGKPTAWSAKIGEVAISGGNAEGLEMEFAEGRVIKLLSRLIAIAAIMFVL